VLNAECEQICIKKFLSKCFKIDFGKSQKKLKDQSKLSTKKQQGGPNGEGVLQHHVHVFFSDNSIPSANLSENFHQ